MRRVVITGMGCITSIGNDVDAFWTALLHGERGASSLEGIAQGDLTFAQAARVRDFKPERYLSQEILNISERSSQFALACAQQAMQRASWDCGPSNSATIFGCSTGGRSVEEAETAKLYRTGQRVHPLTVPRSMASSGTALVAMQHGFQGPAFTLNTACASGAHAIGTAFHMVRSNAVDAAITGGHEAPLTYGFLKAWDSLRVVSKDWCRPFAPDRDGMSLGEGGAAFLLEGYEEARQRGAEILGEIVGFGMSCDASHMTQPNSRGAAQAMLAALRDAGIAPQQISYINAHGTGTQRNDATEASAIQEVFGAQSESLPVSSTKAAHGHAMGASGAMEAIATILALRDGKAPPTAGVSTVDSSLRLELIRGEAREIRGEFAMSNSFAFGGMNAVLVFRSVR